jgi:hypothetical protein
MSSLEDHLTTLYVFVDDFCRARPALPLGGILPTTIRCFPMPNCLLLLCCRAA